MRFSSYKHLVLIVILFLACNSSALSKSPAPELVELLPKEIGGYHLAGNVRTSEAMSEEGLLGPQAAAQALEADRHYSTVEANYRSPDNSLLRVVLVRFSRDSDAYSLLTLAARASRNSAQTDVAKLTKDIGTASFLLPGSVAFFKGPTFVRINAVEPTAQDKNSLLTLAQSISERLAKGEDDIPVLVKHLPQWEKAQSSVIYLAGFRSLRAAIPNQPILETVSSEGDADAVAADYGRAQFLIVEYNTPQLAGDNDRSILSKIEELRTQGQPIPSAYRRVGNYSVFVFNAEDEQTAKALIDQVEYEQVVQWLGDNPYLLEQAQREYYQTTAGVLLAVVKASGLSLLLCLAAGGFIGALLFNRRRAQQRYAEAFSDAGGMLRLNIDEITPQTDPAKLVGPGDR